MSNPTVDPYAQQKAIAQSMQEAVDRNERSQILALLNNLTEEVASIKALLAKPSKKD